MSETKISTALLTERIIKAGFSGLYYSDECACDIGEIAPCGEDPSDCQYGYKHVNPNDTGQVCVSGKETPPTPDEWEKMREL